MNLIFKYCTLRGYAKFHYLLKMYFDINRFLKIIKVNKFKQAEKAEKLKKSFIKSEKNNWKFSFKSMLLKSLL